jgi:molybdopterin-guanine dinucleotide biosynthesis protein
VVLVEGFKAQQGYPKIVCLRGRLDDRDLIDDLTIAAIGQIDRVGDLDVPVFDRDDVGPIADLIEHLG